MQREPELSSVQLLGDWQAGGERRSLHPEKQRWLSEGRAGFAIASATRASDRIVSRLELGGGGAPESHAPPTRAGS